MLIGIRTYLSTCDFVAIMIDSSPCFGITIALRSVHLARHANAVGSISPFPFHPVSNETPDL